MSRVWAVGLLALFATLVCTACQERYPAMDDLEVLTVEGTSIQFYREKPGTTLNRVYMDALGKAVLTLQDNCLRLGEDGPVIIWPPGFTPHVNDGVIEIHDAVRQVVARTGAPIMVAGGQIKKDTGDCPGPTWATTRMTE